MLTRIAALFCLPLLLSTLASAAPPPRLSQDIVPLSQSVRLRLDPAQADYSGSVRIELRIDQPTPNIRLHAERMRLTRTTLSGPAGAVPVSADFGAGDASSTLTLTPSSKRPIPAGRYTLSIEFQNAFGTRAVGLYRMTLQSDKTSYAFTQFEPADAREAFPCFDEPRFKIPFQISLEVPQDLTAVSNTPIAQQLSARGMRTVIFEKTKPLPTYLLAFAVGPFESVPIPGLGVPGEIVVPKGQRHLASLAASMTPPILRALEAYFGRRYPYEKLDFIAVPEFWPGAMEHPGAVTYADRILLVDEKIASPGQRRTLAAVIAHELAHMWFGNLVTMAWWDDLWLNESFASWIGDKTIQKLYPQFRMDLSATETAQSVMFADARPATEAIRQKIEIAEQGLNRVGLAYDKGQAILRMFEAWLGPDRFRDGVLRYLAAHEWGNATADDLWSALSAPPPPSPVPSKDAKAAPAQEGKTPDISAAMATFLDQPGLPLIDVLPMKNGKVRLRQQRFTNHGVSAPPQTWRVPVSLKYRSGGAVRTHTILLDAPEQTISLPLAQAQAPEWIFPFADAVGYYRFTLPQEQLASLLQQAGAHLTPPERLALLGNLAALLDAGLGGVHGDTYLRALARMAADPDPLVVDAVLGDSRMGLGKIHNALVPDALRDRFAAYVRRTLQSPKDRFGLRDGMKKTGAKAQTRDKDGKGDDAVALLRPHLLRWLGDIGKDPDAARLAHEQAQAFIKDPAAADPTLAGSALQVAAATGDQALFDAYRRGFEEARTPVERARFISALGAFRDPALRDQALRYALSKKVRPNEVFTIVHAIRTDEKGRDQVFSWFTQNYAAITARLPDAALVRLPHLASGCEPARLQEARSFFLAPGRRSPATDEELAKVDAQVRDCAALQKREGAAVARFLGAPQK